MSIGAALVFTPQPDIKAELCGLNPQVHRELTASERAEMEALTSEFMGPRRPDVSEPDLRLWEQLRTHAEPNTKSGFAHLVHGKIRKPKVDGKPESKTTITSLVEQAVSSGCLRPATSDDGKPLHRSGQPLYLPADGCEYAGRWVPKFVADRHATADAEYARRLEEYNASKKDDPFESPGMTSTPTTPPREESVTVYYPPTGVLANTPK
jgi:hypothetical protein